MNLSGKLSRLKSILLSPLRINDVVQLLVRSEYRAIKNEIAAVTPDNPALFGRKVYSQFDEDGIIEEISQRLGIDDAGTFIEIGCGSGLENNTHYLLLKGWKGVWVDGSPSDIAFIRSQIPENRDVLIVLERFVDDRSAGEICGEFQRSFGSLDFLSVDIDGNDLAILQSCLKVVDPKFICVEYNAKFPPPLRCGIRYDPNHVWRQDDYHGSSLQMIVDGLPRYKLVSCNICGANAFFVRNDLSGSFPEYSPQQLFQQARHYLAPYIDGHRPTLKFLATKLSDIQAR